MLAGAVASLLVASAHGCGIDLAGTAPGARDGAASEASLPPVAEGGIATDAAVEAATDGSVVDCGDVATSPKNCGACGHDCLGGTCSAGKCQPLVLANNDPGLGAVAIDATTIYYVAENASVIRKLPVTGGPIVDVHFTGTAPHALVLDGDRISWDDQFGAGTFVFASGEKRQDFTSGVRALAKTAGGLYMVTSLSIEYWNRDLTQSLRTFGQTGSSPAIVVDDTYAYWSSTLQIRRVGIGDDAVANVVTGLTAVPTSMAIDATYVYWTTSTKVLRATKAVGTGWTVTELVTGETSAAALEVDATGLYWISLGSGNVRHAPLAGGAAVTLATTGVQLTSPSFQHMIALSPTAIYFASTIDGTLSRLAK